MLSSSETKSPHDDVAPDDDEDEDEDEEEDVDFNPFLKEASSPEASSSISSDDEEVVVDINLNVNVQEQQQAEQVQFQVATPDSRKRKIDLNLEDTGVDSETQLVDKDSDEEDAICRRTRARYSLANCSLDELETFLQETDDDEDVHNVDDEQEYNKFLKAVLEGVENEAEAVQGNGNVDDYDDGDEDDDSDSDVDFEVELEDMLDSDVDESVQEKKNERRGTATTRRVRTRESNGNTKKFLGQGERPLRPLVPIPPLPSANNWHMLTNCVPSSQPGLVNGFTPHQIGQLHCLIHEHTQLLLQVFSLSVLDPSHRKIADVTRGLISELVDERDKVLSLRKVPHPDYCFRAPYIHPSVSNGLYSDQPLHYPVMWVPRVRGPVLSILDAAPLSLVRGYMTDVSRVVQECHKRQLEGSYAVRAEKEPLFPYSSSQISPEANRESTRPASSQGPSTAPSSLNVHQSSKKSLAAVLIENTMKESIAFVPKEIVALAQRFYAFFNEALYPHKPPPPPVANRVCFTDSEDKLLAMGMMEYNTNWGKIQQRFLPCKSKHQIFVRQKNRCSSKAPENPIKAVRRMKTSPLTAEEKAHILQGLKIFKNDWMAVWQFIVPYRDPSLLPRQWRVALGTQKSYKTDEAQKKKRRLYEKQRRLGKAAVLADQQAASDKENNLDTSASEGNKSDNDNVEDEDEAYVHEAFLADWRPGNSGFVSPKIGGSCVSDIPPSNCSERSENYNFLSSCFPKHVPNLSHFTQLRCIASHTMASNLTNPDSLSKPSKRQARQQPHHVTRRKDAQLVKLAPDLPPVNLPPSVRVISQSAFSTYHSVTSYSNKTSSTAVEAENPSSMSSHVAKTGTEVMVNLRDKGTSASSHSTADLGPQDVRVLSDKVATRDDTATTDLQMHPLLLCAPEGQLLPYCQVNSSTCTSDISKVAEGKNSSACASNTLNSVEGKNHHSLTSQSNKTCSTGVETENPVPAPALVAKSLATVSSNSGDKGSTFSKKNSAHPDLQMHPLLLRAEDRRLLYCPVSSNTFTSNNFNNAVGTSYHSVTSQSNRTSSNGVEIETSASTSLQIAKIGAPVSVNSGDKGATLSSHSTATLCPEDLRVHSDQFPTKDNMATRDLQMHPLLLRPPEDQRLPYCPGNSSSSIATTKNFIEGNHLQANFGQFFKPPVADSTVDRSPSSKRPPKSCAIDFHPLLQRTDDGKSAQHRDLNDSVMTDQHVTIQQATEPVLPSPSEMEDELDLEIHLSSSSWKDKAGTGKRTTGYGHNRQSNSLLNFEILNETNKVNKFSQERSSNWPAFSTASSFNNQGLTLGNQMLALSNEASRCLGDHVSNQSLPEIVMEQEELSDSEEENGEDVEFECEEMDDSDREEWILK